MNAAGKSIPARIVRFANEVIPWQLAPSRLDGCRLWLDGRIAGAGSVASWFDKSAIGNHAVQSTAGHRPTAADGRLNFDGSKDYLIVNDNDSLTFGDGATDQPFSIVAKVINDSPSSTYTILSKASSSTSGEYYFFVSVNGLYFRLVDGSTGGYIGRSCAYTFTNAKHVAVTYDGSGASSGIKIYIDGVEQSTSASSSGSYTAMENTDKPMEIGRRGTSLYWNGKIFDCSIFGQVLKAGEILALYRYSK